MNVKSIAIVATVLLMSACGGKTSKSVSDTDSVQADTLAAENQESSIDKHTEDYLRQRVDSMYSEYKNPKYDKIGMRIYNGKRIDKDSAYCSKSYKELMSKALDIADENEEPLLDYDHWTNSQDDNNFTYKVGKISNMTDSTAIVTINGKISGPHTITLSMRFERGDWYVDDFLGDDGTGEKVYFKDYIQKNNFYKQFSLNDLLYLMQHYAESAKAEKSGLGLIYHDSQTSDEVDEEQYVYGHDIYSTTKKELGYELNTSSAHAFYFLMSLDTSRNGYLRFFKQNDANAFFERVRNTKPFTFEGKRIVVTKVSGDKSARIEEVRSDKSTSTMFEVHQPTALDGWYEIYLEIYV